MIFLVFWALFEAFFLFLKILRSAERRKYTSCCTVDIFLLRSSCLTKKRRAPPEWFHAAANPAFCCLGKMERILEITLAKSCFSKLPMIRLIRSSFVISDSPHCNVRSTGTHQPSRSLNIPTRVATSQPS